LTPLDRGDYILKFILSLAHEDDNEIARATSLQILNKLAVYLSQEFCEGYIVKEIKSLALDSFPMV